VITEAWINIIRGHFNYSHKSSGQPVFRRVLCERRHDKVKLEFKTPITAHTYTISKRNGRRQLQRLYRPRHGDPPVTGDLLIFPSWLLHRVNMSQSEEERISIAFNSRAAKSLDGAASRSSLLNL